jgi:hypothetical protein
MREDSQTVGSMHNCNPTTHLAAMHESAGHYPDGVRHRIEPVGYRVQGTAPNGKRVDLVPAIDPINGSRAVDFAVMRNCSN